MGIKDLFSKDKNTSIVPLTNKEDLAKDVESPEYYSSQIQEKRRFEPHVDYSLPQNFAKFGSANKYYTDAITAFTRLIRLTDHSTRGYSGRSPRLVLIGIFLRTNTREQMGM